MNTQNFHIGAGSLQIGGVDIGATTPNGAVVNYAPNIHLHESGKYGKTPVKASLIGKLLTIEIEMAETTKANMLKLFAGATGVESGKIKFGGAAGANIAGAELVLTPFDGTPEWVFRNAIPTSEVATNYTVEDERVFKVTMTGMVDTSAPEDENVGYVS